MKNYYQILGVSSSVSFKEIKSAYRKLSLKLHPDVNKSADAYKKFSELNEAYHILKDPLRRARYDALLKSDSQNRKHKRWERKTQKSADKVRERSIKNKGSFPKESSNWWLFDIFGELILELTFKAISTLFN